MNKHAWRWSCRYCVEGLCLVLATSHTGLRKLHQHYFRKTGMKLIPGTLNVQFDEAYLLPEQVIRLEAEEYGAAAFRSTSFPV